MELDSLRMTNTHREMSALDVGQQMGECIKNQFIDVFPTRDVKTVGSVMQIAWCV